MENYKFIQIVKNLRKKIESGSFEIPTIIEELQKARICAIEEKNPRLVKVIRLTFEHLENYQGFFISIPEDTFEEDEENAEVTYPTENQVESLLYLLSLMLDPLHKRNALEIKDYIDALNDYAENN
ncbi:hypothetical protein [Aureivirga sp. CE67]|uniref:hypothetical protein n=1 Tax=Aureivirga sp. CE67 TaxID=1788983 RepID=UPI0018CB8774|nr:hypothetical protein [Aureivirga sp. CE67]